MAKTDWAALQKRFLIDYAKQKISPQVWCEMNDLSYASARRYIKKPTAQEIAKIAQNKTAQSEKTAQKKLRNAQSGKACPEIQESGKDSRSKSTTAIRGSRTAPPSNPFPKGQTLSLEHGGYAQRMLLPDNVVEDAKALTLYDELFRLRANNLMAGEAIGRARAQMEEDPDASEACLSLIESADKAMMRNTVRIESLERTIGLLNMGRLESQKMAVDIEYRQASTDKVREEIELLRNGDNSDNATVVHNMLPMHGSVE